MLMHILHIAQFPAKLENPFIFNRDGSDIPEHPVQACTDELIVTTPMLN